MSGPCCVITNFPCTLYSIPSHGMYNTHLLPLGSVQATDKLTFKQRNYATGPWFGRLAYRDPSFTPDIFQTHFSNKNVIWFELNWRDIKTYLHFVLFLNTKMTWLVANNSHGRLTRYVKLRVAHAPGMPGLFPRHRLQRPQTASWRSRHASRHVRHTRAVMHVEFANPRWRGKRSRHFRRMRNPQFYVSGKRPMKDTDLPFF